MADNTNALLAALTKLTKLSTSEGLVAARSLFTQNQRRELDLFSRSTGAIESRKAGNGSCYAIKHPSVISLKVSELSPVVSGDIRPDAPKRARNIAMRRNSKVGEHGHGCYYLLMRARAGGIWRNKAGQVMDLSAMTDTQGAGVLRLEDGLDPGWSTDGTLWLVENQEVFDRLDWLEDKNASVGFYKGMLPNQLLSWLEAAPRAAKIVLFADYDGVGLMNFSRILNAVGSDVEFWLMPEWLAKLRKFGNNDVWVNTLPHFTAAKAELKKHRNLPAEFWSLVNEMDKQGLALEHEIVGILEMEGGVYTLP